MLMFNIAMLWLLPALSLPAYYRAAAGKLARNGISGGIRLPSTLASDAAWRAGHRAAIPITWLTVPVALAGTAGAAMVHGPSRSTIVALTILGSAVILLAGAVIAGKAARRVGSAD
jgi:hypothetical protein